MLASSVPTKFNIGFGASAGPSFIRAVPQASQIGILAGAASLTDGFPPVTFNPIAAGGTPPYGADFNGILNQITLWNQWQSAGGPILYDGTFATAIGGYPKGAILQSSATIGLLWTSLIDNNSTNPDSGGTNWIALGTATTGALQFRPTSESIPGWVPANGLTIGSASSGATGLAAATAVNLFGWLWSNFSNTQCPVSGGRGASPAADFAANKTITLLDWRGRGFIGTDGMGNGTSGRLASIPVTSGAVTTPGSIIGENLHTLTSPGEIPAHNHTITISDPTHLHSYQEGINSGGTAGGGGLAPFYNYQAQNTTAASTGITASSTNTGSSGGHNTVEASYTGYVYLKL